MTRIFLAGGVMLALAAPATGSALLDVFPAGRYLDGPPPGFSGGFQEESCHACHFSSDVNAPGGSLSLAGVPERYTPGEKYPITVRLTKAGLGAGGFQLAARFETGGQQAGTLASLPEDSSRVRVTLDRDVQYAYQLEEGSKVGNPEMADWTIVWVAPESREPVVFHAAANAADGDGSTKGDLVYTTSAHSRP
jgi:hypothetical protein